MVTTYFHNLNKVLFVDDEPEVLAAFKRNLRKHFNIETAEGGERALEMISRNGPYAVIVTDMRMPSMSGLELLERVALVSPRTVRLMLTGNVDQETAINAVNRGHVFRFLNKPCSLDILRAYLELALKEYEVAEVQRNLLEGTVLGTVQALIEILGSVSPQAAGRGRELQDAMRAFALEIGATPVWEFQIAGMLSQIGCVALPTEVMPTDEGAAKLGLLKRERVPEVGAKLLSEIPRFEGPAQMILYQNKNFDGDGFPSDGVQEADIPLGARMLRILNDALPLLHADQPPSAIRAALESPVGSYDPELLQKYLLVLETQMNSPAGGVGATRELGIADLSPGHVVASAIKSHLGLTLLDAGTRLTDAMVCRLRNHQEIDELRGPIIVRAAAA